MTNWEFIKNKLAENKTLYLMIVTQAKGSSPGKQGFSMALCDDDSLIGSIGGGTMEYNLVEECKILLKEKKQTFFKKNQIHNDKPNNTGMLCSGEQTVAFIPIDFNNKQLVDNIINCINNNKKGILTISSNTIDFKLTDLTHDNQYQYTEKEKSWTYNEIIGFKNTIYIIGAGHVGFAVSRLFSQLGFRIILMDNRNDLEMMNNNNYASEKKTVDYNDIHKHVVAGPNNFVVIMTNNHQHDVNVLEKLLRNEFCYIGLMGSRSKIAKFKQSLSEQGFTKNELDKVHAPIGMQINSITPDEIAISIAAEVIKVKNQ